MCFVDAKYVLLFLCLWGIGEVRLKIFFSVLGLTIMNSPKSLFMKKLNFFLGLPSIAILVFLMALQSCAPSLKLNRSSGLIQINNNVELRAKPKGFKKKNGPVEIKWFVNGELVANTENFLFSTTETGQYTVRAEAVQGEKNVESEIKLDAGVFDPRLVDLVNGIEPFSVKPESPIKEIKSSRDTLPEEIKKDPSSGKETRTVWAEENKTYSASKNPDEFVMYDPNANVLWPGALIQGKSIASGVPDIIPISTTHRLPGKVTLSILSGDGSSVENKFFRETEMTKSGVTQAMNDILAGYKGGTPAQYSYSKAVVNSASQVQFALNMGYAGPATKADGKLGVNWSEKKSRMVVKLYQKFFTMTFDDPQGVAGVFRPSIQYNDLEPYVGAGNPACYISGVTYGRIYVLLYESESSQADLEAALNFAYDGVVASGSVESELKTSFSNGSIKVKAFQVGGNATEGLDAALDPLNPDKIRNFIVNGANFSSENPGEIISYTINYLKDASLVRMNSAMEYTVTNKEPISSDEYVIVPALINKPKAAAEALLKKDGLRMKIFETVKKCEKEPGMVDFQNYNPGYLIKAGSEIEVKVVADRPFVGAPSIVGGGDLHRLSPEESYGAGTWGGTAVTGVKFGLEGDECTSGSVVVNHNLKGDIGTYSIKAGQQIDISRGFGAGYITVKFISNDDQAKLHLRIW